MYTDERTKTKKDKEKMKLPLKNFYIAEEYHQDYLVKHTGVYFHIDLNLADGEIERQDLYSKITQI